MVQGITSGKVEVVDFLLSEGFSATNYAAFASPLRTALSRQDIPMLKLLLEKGNLFRFVDDLIIEKPELKEIGETDNPEILQLFFEYFTKYNRERLTLAILGTAVRCKEELKIVRYLIKQNQPFNESEIEEIIQTVQRELSSFEKLNSTVFVHLLKNGKTLSAWREILALSADISRTLDQLDIEDPEEKECLAYDKIVREIFDFVYGRLSSETARSSEFLQKLSCIVKMITDRNQIGFLFNGLKTHATIEALEEAIEMAHLYFQAGIPSQAQFEQISSAEQKKWLQYISTARLREGLGLCLWTLNHSQEKESLFPALYRH